MFPSHLVNVFQRLFSEKRIIAFNKTPSKQFSQLLSSFCATTRCTQAVGREEDQVCIV
jgi:hypothetical protein